jgi:glutamine synthetase
MKAKKKREEALHAVIKDVMDECGGILFNDDGYSDDWQTEAKKRKLLNLKTTMDAIDRFLSKTNIALFKKYGVLSERELAAREEIYYDQYFKTINIEAETTERIARTLLLPACFEYVRDLTNNARSLSELGMKSAAVTNVLQEVIDHTDSLSVAIERLRVVNKELGGTTVHEKAHHMYAKVIPAMNLVRAACDRLERSIPERLWSLPSYREMLWIK